MKKLLIGAVALLFSTAAFAQTLPTGAVATGRGNAVSGLNGVAPGSAGTILASNGAGSQPSFQSFSTLGLPVLVGNNTFSGVNAFGLSNSGTSNAFPISSSLQRTTTVGTGGIFMAGNFVATDAGSTAATSNQGIRSTVQNDNTGGGSSFGDVGGVFTYLANQNQGTWYGINLTGSIAAGKTVTTWYGIQIDAPTGAGTATNKRAININPSAGPIVQGDTTASTSSTTGALQVAGGAGIQGAAFIGGAVTTGSNVAMGGALFRGSPVTKTGDFTLGVGENWVINNKAGSNLSVTLPSAATFAGREIMFKTIVAFSIVSASSNVVPRAGGAAGTTITGNVAGNWATIVSDGTNWVLMQGS